jgi:two-component system, LuxR family, response regulator FixJ
MGVNRNIYLVDDEAAVCHALSVLLEGSGYRVRVYHSAETYLEMEGGDTEGVMLLDQCMPGMTGLELQAELTRRDIALPIIFITGHMDEQIYDEAVKAGAIDILNKPFRNESLLESISGAFAEADVHQVIRHSNVKERKRPKELLI